MKSVLDLVTRSSVDGDNKSDVDFMFEVLEFWLCDKNSDEFAANYPDIAACGACDDMFACTPTEYDREIGNYALDFYKRFKQAAGKTMKSILISCSARLSVFAIKSVLEKTSRDELELDKIGDRKTALFLVIDDMKTTYNFLVTIMYSQMFTLLAEKVYNMPKKRLKYHVRFMLDEFANCGRIPDFEQIITVIRSRGMSAFVVVQAISQIKSLYKESAGTIIGACDSHLFLGSQEWETVEWFSKVLGKETIDTTTSSTSKGTNSGSFSENRQRTGRELMTPDELLMLDGRKCVLKIRGVKPFLSNKNDPKQHRRYLETSYKTGKRYDVKAAVKRRAGRIMRQRKSDNFETYAVEITDKGADE
jgi:type IV secretion system protein VirD4